jgi:hypothetical protein
MMVKGDPGKKRYRPWNRFGKRGMFFAEKLLSPSPKSRFNAEAEPAAGINQGQAPIKG